MQTWKEYQGEAGRRLIAEAKAGLEPIRRKRKKGKADRRYLSTVDCREWQPPFRIADWARPLFDRITAAHEGLVRKVAWSFIAPWPRHKEDILASGRIGLLYAVASFDPERGVDFATLARWHILHHVQREVQFHSRDVRLSVRLQEALSKAVRAGAITAEEAVAATGKQALADYWQGLKVKSFDAPRFEEADGRTLHDRVAADGTGPDDAAESSERVDAVRAALACLSPAETEVIKLRWLTRAPKARNPHEENGGDEMRTLSEVGRMKGRSRERIRQIEMGAFEKLAWVLKRRLKDAA